MDSLVEKEVLEDASAFVNELEENSEYKVTTTARNSLNATMIGKQKRIKECQQNSNSNQIDENGNLIRPKYLSNHTIILPQIAMPE